MDLHWVLIKETVVRGCYLSSRSTCFFVIELEAAIAAVVYHYVEAMDQIDHRC